MAAPTRNVASIGSKVGCEVSVALSVVVVHWNVPELLDACLRSIADECRTTPLATEVVVVDCSSPEPSYREVVTSYPDVRLVELPDNRGYAAGCNAGIAGTSGEAILLLNPDTELLPGALGRLWEVLHVAVHVGMVAPTLLNPDGSLQSRGYRFPGIANVQFDLFPLHSRLIDSTLNGRMPASDGVQPVRIDYPLGAAMMVRREAVVEIGGMDEGFGMYSEEIDWANRFAREGWSVLLAPDARVVHHGAGSTSQRAVEMHEALWMSRARYHERWIPRWKRWIIAALVELALRRDNRRADDGRRGANARIRDRFRRMASTR